MARSTRFFVLGALMALLESGIQPAARGDEGMWLLNAPPTKILKEKHNFDLTKEWLLRAQKGSIRFNNGGSGSFVSANGLILTNHHIGADSLHKLSTAEKDLLKLGFCAHSMDQELKCPDLELNVLQSIEDVTEQVNAGVAKEASPADAAKQRRAVMAKIEKASLDKTGFRSDIVTLYQGGAYHLYCYKKYTDVRLVFAPESEIASFGGDVDNFEYPRFNLDICFFRAYENDAPAKVEHYFRWSKAGPKEGDLVFVTGHPGTTNRLETVAKLEHRRDHTLPYMLARQRSREAALIQFSQQSKAQAAMAAEDIHSVANARKALTGQMQGLLVDEIMNQKRAEEAKLVEAAKSDSQKAAALDHALKSIADVQRKFEPLEVPYGLIERGDGFFADLFTIARHLVRLSVELPKPSAERLREYRETNLESLKLQIFSPAKIQAELERAKMECSLMFLAEKLGGQSAAARLALAGKSPAVRANELIAGTKLFDVAYRKQLFEGGAKAIEGALSDPMIALAVSIDPHARELRRRFETDIEEPERQAFAQISKARFDAAGSAMPPDATFTLRLAFGINKGYEEGNLVRPSTTTVKGLFERYAELGPLPPFSLPKSWIEGAKKIDPATPFNFASTSDTIGGNSGSPVLNREGELIGVNFDRNRQGLVRNFVYTEVGARHISVHSKGILTALRDIYRANELIKELGGTDEAVKP